MICPKEFQPLLALLNPSLIMCDTRRYLAIVCLLVTGGQAMRSKGKYVEFNMAM